MSLFWLGVLTHEFACSLEASNALINRCAEHLCSNLAGYAREGKETNIWRDFGAPGAMGPSSMHA